MSFGSWSGGGVVGGDCLGTRDVSVDSPFRSKIADKGGKIPHASRETDCISPEESRVTTEGLEGREAGSGAAGGSCLAADAWPES